MLKSLLLLVLCFTLSTAIPHAALRALQKEAALSSTASSVLFSEKDIASSRIRGTEDEILSYWTPERMNAANPVPVPINDDPSDGSQQSKPDGPAGVEVPKVSEFLEVPDSTLLEAQELLMAASPETVNNPKAWPTIVVGKVYFTRNKRDWVCSASQIQQNMVLTAGHCVHNYTDGGWATYFAFVPAYPALTTKYAARWLYAWSAWTGSKKWPYDYAFASFGAKPQFTSWSGTAWNQPISNAVQFKALGYPAESPYPGNKMYQVTNAALVPQTIAVSGTVQMPNKMTGGCSGGPWWNLNISPTGTYNGPWANGVNSFRKTTEPQNMYSPYFTTDFKTLFYWVKNQQFNA